MVGVASWGPAGIARSPPPPRVWPDVACSAQSSKRRALRRLLLVNAAGRAASLASCSARRHKPPRLTAEQHGGCPDCLGDEAVPGRGRPEWSPAAAFRESPPRRAVPPMRSPTARSILMGTRTRHGSWALGSARWHDLIQRCGSFVCISVDWVPFCNRALSCAAGPVARADPAPSRRDSALGPCGAGCVRIREAIAPPPPATRAPTDDDGTEARTTVV